MLPSLLPVMTAGRTHAMPAVTLHSTQLSAWHQQPCPALILACSAGWSDTKPSSQAAGSPLASFNASTPLTAHLGCQLVGHQSQQHDPVLGVQLERERLLAAVPPPAAGNEPCGGHLAADQVDLGSVGKGGESIACDARLGASGCYS